MFQYSKTNLLTAATLSDTSTENAIYIDDYLYDGRPSKPFYFTAKTSQWIKIDLGGAVFVDIFAIFNHNFLSAATLGIQGNAADAWGAPSFTAAPAWRKDNFYHRPRVTYEWWRFLISDAGNPYYPRVGELWLSSSLSTFANAHAQPGRQDGLGIEAIETPTIYGQDWDVFLSSAEDFTYSIYNLSDPDNIDDLQTFIEDIKGPEGRFLFIPDPGKPHVYLAKLTGSPQATRLVTGEKSLRAWNITIKALTKGITLL